MSELVIDESGAVVTVRVRHHDAEIELPALWLRERSHGPHAVDARTGQRLFDPHLLPVDLAVVSAAIDTDDNLRVLFSDGHHEAFDPYRLLGDLTLDDALPDQVMWTSRLGRPPAHDWTTLDQPVLERAAIRDFLRLGVIVIDNVPTAGGAVLDVASRFGFVRDTNFGAMFDVRSVPDSTDLAYRSVALGPHTDNPYRLPAPGIQLLLCVVNDTAGGETTLVDGLAAVAKLATDDPSAVELLATTALRFRYRDDTTDIIAVRPIIERDHAGRVTALNYSPRLDAMPLLPVGEMQRYQAARQQLAELLTSGEFEVRFTLAPGQVVMFANDRVLHGRTAFDPGEGSRHLQGCYIDHDGPAARYRMLSHRAVAASENGR